MLSTPTGATVVIDDNPLGVTPLTAELRPGVHTLTVTLRGYTDASNQFNLSATAPLDVPIELRPAPIQAATASQNHQRRFGVAPYVTLGAGALLLGAAGIYELKRRSAQSTAEGDATQLDYEHDVDAMNSRQSTARVLLGIGGAVALTGGALLIFNTRLGSDSRASVSASPAGATLLLEHRF